MANRLGELETGNVAVSRNFHSHTIPAYKPTVEQAEFHRDLWTRMEFQGVPIYVRSDKPNWFVPNDAGDEILRQMSTENGVCSTVSTLRFLERLPCSPKWKYPGRSAWLKTDELKELWFHITNQCDRHCSHCLFECTVPNNGMLGKERIFTLADQAYQAGCRFFMITGGEPLMHPDFTEIVGGLLSRPDCHVAVLTNGLLIESHMDAINHWPRERFHLQISLDGNQKTHDSIRGPGAFDLLMKNFAHLRKSEIPLSISMCVESDNMNELTEVVEIAARVGVCNIHYLWYFAAGRGNVFELADPEELFDRLVPACKRAEELGVTIDNVEQIYRQVFGPCGMIYDGNNSGWESLAIGPDGHLYPSPALVGMEKLKTPLNDDLIRAWRQSPVLEELRQSTIAELSSPMLTILGGGDQDHSYIRSGKFIGFDPYWSLYEKIALWLIAEQAKDRPSLGPPRLRLKMGEVIAHNGSRRQVSLRHTKSLCAVASKGKTIFLHELYTRKPQEQPEVTFHTVLLPESRVRHIPVEYRRRSYCFASPAGNMEFGLGQKVLEIGSDTGIGCLIASKQVGPNGFVIGVESQDDLLDWAQRAAQIVGKRLGYHNVEFHKGTADDPLPVKEESMDVVILNCAINRAYNKRRLFENAFRVLRPQGCLIISDIICDDESESLFCAENILCGQSLASALTSRDMLGLLDESGFICPEIIKWGSYRVTNSYSFHRVMLEAQKPMERDRRIRVMYRGPFAAVVTSNGTLLTPGIPKNVTSNEIDSIGENIFIVLS